jgi:phytoene synthase
LEGSNESSSLDRILAEGSKSFNTASKLLPSRIRKPVTVLYAFCRIADDVVDDAKEGGTALESLRARLDDLYEGRITNHPLDAAFHGTVSVYRIPKEIFLAMFEGFLWDSENKRYETIGDTLDYSARVASTVGVMMSLIMGERRPEVLARACDLGIAMQLVNICRDVGEDADRGRMYLPSEWLAEVGIDRDRFLAHPVFTPAMGEVVKRTLEVASRHFALANIGISRLPKDARLAIRAAALIYADIGRVIRKNRYDSVSTRAYTSKLRKLVLVLKAFSAKFWSEKPNEEPAHPSVKFLIDAVASHDATHPSRGAAA